MKYFFILFLSFNSLFALDRFVDVYGESSSSYEPNYIIIKSNLIIEDSSFEKAQKRLNKIINKHLLKDKLSGLKKDNISIFIQKGIEKKSYIRKIFYLDCMIDVKIDNIALFHNVYEDLTEIDKLKVLKVISGRYDDKELYNRELEKAYLNAKEKAKVLAKISKNRIAKTISIKEIESKKNNQEDIKKKNLFVNNKIEYNIKLEVKFKLK